MADATRSCSISRPPRIAEALRKRAPLAEQPGLSTYRLFHYDADGVPGLAIDRFGTVAVIHADSPEVLERWAPTLESELADYDVAYAKIHPRRANRLSAVELSSLAPPDPLWGNPVEELEVLEGGVRYLIRPGAGLSPGLFLDTREVRAWLRHSVSGRSVLNVFAYTCSFGLSATLGNAQRVINLDLSRPSLAWGQDNYRLNDRAVDQRDFIYGDVFDWLSRFARRQQTFGLVIVDPPSFSSSGFSVQRDYPRLVSAAARTVAPAGMLLAATNHAGTSDAHFDLWLGSGLKMARRDGRLLHSWHEPGLDFPVAAGGSPYLKVRALVLD